MEVELSVSEDGQYVLMVVVGDIDRASALKANIEAHGYGRKLGLNKYLVDVTRSRNVETPLGNYQFSYQDMKSTEEIDPLAIVALLVAPDDHSHDFVETVARNTGLNVTLFRDRAEAIDHLRVETTQLV